MAKPKKQIKLLATEDGKEWKVGVVGDPVQVPAKKNDEGLELEFVNVTPKEAGAPDILLRFVGLCSINAFKNPHPKKIRDDQPYSLEPGGGDEDFDIRQHLGVLSSGSPKERIYEVFFKAEVEGSKNTGGDPGDTVILIEC
jgi:hypothetical protein